LPLKRSIFDGLSVNLVKTSRGDLAFGVADIYLPGGPTPIAFQRSYVSDRKEDIGLGVGWSFGFSDKINVAGDVAKLSDVSGTLEFRRVPQSRRFALQSDEPGLHQQFEITDSTTITERTSDVTRVYTKIGDAYQLSRVTGSRGISILVTHDAAGRLTRVANDPGAWIAFEWSEGRDVRLLGVVDSSGRRISFRQDGGLLRTVVDQTGAEWTYDYTNKGLRQAIDPIGRVLLRARYDKFGRVAAAGDAFGLTRYDYESRRTIVTDPLGAVTVYEQTDRGAVASVTDDEDRRVSMQYNGANRLVRVSDSTGNEMTFSHDSENRLVSQSTNGNVDRAVTFGTDGQPSSLMQGTERTDLSLDERGQIISSQSSNSANSYSARYDSRGQIVNLKLASREVSFEYDANGNEIAMNHSEVGRFTYARDPAGRVVAANYPSGLSYFNE